MSPDGVRDQEKRFAQFKELCYNLGLAFVTWQELEDAHFNLFFRMLGSSDTEIASVVYYHTESFEARHRLVGYMAQIFLQDKTHKKVWENDKGGLKKEIKTANDNRNKLAHYAEDFDISDEQITHPDGSITLEVSEPRLRPSRYNTISRLIGRTPDKPEHNLSVKDIRSYVLEFRSLTKKIGEFWASLPVPKEANLVQSLGLPPRHVLRRPRRSRTRLGKVTAEPSEK
jgi:hypothetical protein